MHYYDHHIGDYRRDTSALSVTEHGVYRLLLDEAYATERPLPAAHAALCRIVRAQNKAERDAVAHVAATFFRREGDGLVHGRVQREIAKFHATSEKKRDAANKRWQSKSTHGDAKAMQVDMQVHSESTSKRNANQYPITNNHKNASHSAHAEGHEWLNSLRAKYPDIDIDVEWAKAREWYDSRNLVCTRPKFEDWLTRAEPSLPKAPKRKKLTEMSEAERVQFAKSTL